MRHWQDRVHALAHALAKERRAVTAIEYALIGALIFLVIIGALSNVGTKLPVVFNSIKTAI